MLTPLDSPIFDEDVVADMESRIEEMIPCLRADAAAGYRLSVRCCGSAAFLCAVHRARVRYEIQVALLLPRMVVTCADCGHQFWDATRIGDVVREVPL